MKYKSGKYPHLSTEQLLDIVCKKLPVVKRIINQYGDLSLAEYVQTLVPNVETPYQQRDDLLDVVYRYIAPLLGETIAQQTVRDLDAYPVILTANHHGVEYYSQTFQARLIFSLNALADTTPISTIPIFSFGNVPLNNATYPRGILLYRFNSNNLEAMPKKLPIFPDRFKRQMVSVVPPFDQIMISRAEVRLDKMMHDRHISSTLAASLHTILREDYCHASVAGLRNYSQQSVVVNNRIWKRLFSKIKMVPELIYLELEKIAGALLRFDLSNSDSLAYQIMFNTAIREHLLSELDGCRACWERQKLVQRFRMDSLNTVQRKKLEGCGTIFFWGVDHRMRRIPLSLETNVSGNTMLRGIDDHGNLWEIPYTAQTILHELQENKLLPSLFTCFLVLSFARGCICIGSYFQCEYLPLMQQGIVNVLHNMSGYHDITRFVAQVSTDRYLGGMLAIMTQPEHDRLIPAGPLEIIASEGITGNDIERMLSLTVRDAHLADMFDTALDAIPAKLRKPGWKTELATDCYQLLKGKIVIK